MVIAGGAIERAVEAVAAWNPTASFYPGFSDR